MSAATQYFPGPHAGDSVVYLMAWEGGIVKVGQTKDFPTRYRAHCSNARVRDRRVIEAWAAPSLSVLEDEQMLMKMCRVTGGVPMQGSREWFAGADGVKILDFIEAAREQVAS